MPDLDVQATLTNSTTNETLSVRPDEITTTGNHEDSGRIEIATSETTHTISTDIGNAGYSIWVNRDATNYVELGFATGNYPVKLLAGQVALIPLADATATIYLRANTAACDVQFKIYEQ